MMDERLLRNKIRRARKDYKCEACLFFFGPAGEAWDDIKEELRWGHPEEYTLAESKAIIKAWRNWRTIRKGEMYRYQYFIQENYHYKDWAVVYEGTTWRTFRAIPEMHDICIKYGIYNL